MVSGLVKMPSNIFANTGTNVSILFIDKSKKNQTIFLIDATKLGRMIKTDDKNERRFLSKNDEKLIFETFKSKDIISNFSIEVKSEDVIKKNFSLNPGLYFPITITPSNFSKDEIKDKVNVFKKKIIGLRKESADISKLIDENLDKIKYE